MHRTTSLSRSLSRIDKFPSQEKQERSRLTCAIWYIPASSLQRYHEDWVKEEAKSRDSKEPKQQETNPWQGLHETTEKGGKDNSIPFIGADDQVKKPPAYDRNPLAQRVLAEMAENQKKTA